MIGIEEIKSKNNLELIETLLGYLKTGKVVQFYLLNDLIRVMCLNGEVLAVERVFNDFLCSLDEDDEYSALIQGFVYHVGPGALQNFEKAMQLYDKAISNNNMQAMWLKATMYMDGKGCESSYSEAIPFLDRAIELGSDEARYLRAVTYIFDEDTSSDGSEAIRLLDEAIELGNISAKASRALMFQYGQGREQNILKAAKLFGEAVDFGHIDSMLAVAEMHLYGQLGEQNFSAAVELFDIVISLGDLRAAYSRAEMYERGFGSAIDMVSAARLYRKYLVSREVVDKDVEAKLKSSSDVIFQFHYAMLHKDFSKVGVLAETSNLVIKELVEYELQCNLTHEDIDIEEFFTQCTRDLVDTRINAFCWSVLLSIYGMEKEGEIISAHLISLRLNCLSAIDVTSLRGDYLITIIEMVINVWYCTSEFTSKATDILCQTMHGLSFYRTPIDNQLLRKIASIVVKVIYGDDYEVNFESVDLPSVMYLMSKYECLKSHQVLADDADDLLRKQFIFKIAKEEATNPMLRQLGFFTDNPVCSEKDCEIKNTHEL